MGYLCGGFLKLGYPKILIPMSDFRELHGLECRNSTKRVHDATILFCSILCLNDLRGDGQ